MSKKIEMKEYNKYEVEEEKQKMEREILEKETEKSSVRNVAVKGQREITKFEIINENLVPRYLCSPDESKIRKMIRDLCSPDESKIRKMIEAGIKEIAGVKVWKEKVIY